MTAQPAGRRRDLDPFDAWRLDTSYGPVFVQLSRQLRADEPAAAFRPDTWATSMAISAPR